MQQRVASRISLRLTLLDDGNRMESLFRLVFALFLLDLNAILSVKITNLKVPSTFILDDFESPVPLTLDCDYEIGPKDSLQGFVLKWYFDGSVIYQWITGRQPIALNEFKTRIDTNFSLGMDKSKLFRALRIPKPDLKVSGEFSCSVQTFESIDKRSAKLQVVVPESTFWLEHNKIYTGIVRVTCGAENVFPEPKLSILLGNDHLLDVARNSVKNTEGLFNTTIKARVHKNILESPTTIFCVLKIPHTSYVKKREAIYYDAPMSVFQGYRELLEEYSDEYDYFSSCSQAALSIYTFLLPIFLINVF